MLKIIYDASILTNVFYKNSGRSGIFFVAQNILDELLKRPFVKVYLYFAPEAYADGSLLQKMSYSEIECVQDLSRHFFLCKLYRKLRYWYFLIYHRTFLRKFIALGLGVLYRFFLLTEKIERDKLEMCDAFLSPLSNSPKFVRKMHRIKTYVFIHDVIPLLFPQFYSNQKFFISKIIGNPGENDYFFFGSRCSKNDTMRLFPSIVKENASVTYLAANERFKQVKNADLLTKIKRKYHIPGEKKYVFSLCTIEPRKNLIRAVDCFMRFLKKNNIDDLVWIMGGGHWDSFVKELKKKGVKWDSNYIRQVGYVDDDDLPVLYSNAEWFVYTSQYEGFGLPPLEAMQCGCPVITSNNSSLPEVVGDAGIMIDWDSDEQHVKAFEKYYFDEKLRKENSCKGLQRAKLFSWEKTVTKMLSAMFPDTSFLLNISKFS